MTRPIERHGQHIHRPHECAEDGTRVGCLAHIAFEAVVERGDHAAVEAGAGHQQERLLVCMRAHDRGRGPVQQHVRNGARLGREADFVGKHVTRAHGYDAERRVGAKQNSSQLADRPVSTGRDDGVIASARCRLARRAARRTRYRRSACR